MAAPAPAPAPAAASSSSSSKRARTTAVQLPPALGECYELHSVRGKGQDTEVWEARDLRTGRKVAIKILLFHAGDGDGKARRKVEREVRVMRLLSLRRHPHIIRFYDAIFTEGQAYIVMELAESGQLHDHVVTQGRLAEAEARRLFQQLAAAVRYCHRSMVVHRDLKMENVLLDAEGNVKVADFGFSKILASHAAPLRKRKGNLYYAAPELYADTGECYMGPQVDVWSCGVILYGMLCGSLPFDDADVSELIKNIRRGDLRLIKAWVSDDARDLIAGMLIVRPEKRMSMDEVWAHRWLQPDMPAYLLRLPLPLPPHHRQVHQQLVLAAMNSSSSSCSTAAATAATMQWALGGMGATKLLHQCPRETMRYIDRALRELGMHIILSYHYRHRMVAVVPVPIVRSRSSCSPAAVAALSSHDDDSRLSSAAAQALFFEIQLYKSGDGNPNPNHNKTAAAASSSSSYSQQPQIQYVLNLKRTSGPQLAYLRICSQLASKLT